MHGYIWGVFMIRNSEQGVHSPYVDPCRWVSHRLNPMVWSPDSQPKPLKSVKSYRNGPNSRNCIPYGLCKDLPRPSSYPLLRPKYPLLGTIYPQVRVQGGSWFRATRTYILGTCRVGLTPITPSASPSTEAVGLGLRIHYKTLGLGAII